MFSYHLVSWVVLFSFWRVKLKIPLWLLLMLKVFLLISWSLWEDLKGFLLLIDKFSNLRLKSWYTQPFPFCFNFFFFFIFLMLWKLLHRWIRFAECSLTCWIIVLQPRDVNMLGSRTNSMQLLQIWFSWTRSIVLLMMIHLSVSEILVSSNIGCKIWVQVWENACESLILDYSESAFSFFQSKKAENYVGW